MYDNMVEKWSIPQIVKSSSHQSVYGDTIAGSNSKGPEIIQLSSVEEALSREVIRKLKLASEADSKEDREIICEELFCDITGTLDAHSQKRLLAPEADFGNGLEGQLGQRGGNVVSMSNHGNSGGGGASEAGPSPGGRGGASNGTNTPPAFYEILARFYQQSRDSGEVVAHLCQRLWGQGYAAPIFALLLHRWLLLGRENADSGTAGTAPATDGHEDSSPQMDPVHDDSLTSGSWLSPLRKLHSFQPPILLTWQTATGAQPQQPQRIKQISVLVLGARQLFLGDVHTGQTRFAALYHCLADEVVMGPGFKLLANLPVSMCSDLCSVVAALLPYYAVPGDMHILVGKFPPPNAARAAAHHHHHHHHHRHHQSHHQSTGLSQSSLLQSGDDSLPWTAGSGTDFLMAEVSDMLSKIRSEVGLLTYLAALQVLKGNPHLRLMHRITSLRLQSELYSLTSLGGPHYAPRSVRDAAMDTLDAIYPLGRRTRRVVRTLFRLLHPTDWFGEFWIYPLMLWSWIYKKVLKAACRAIYKLVSWKPVWGKRVDQGHEHVGITKPVYPDNSSIGNGHNIDSGSEVSSRAGRSWRGWGMFQKVAKKQL